MLAALPKAPNHYSPLHEGNEERSEKRRKIVLNVMKDEGLITEREWEAALESPLALNKENGIYANEAYFTYIDMVLEEAQKEYGISEEEILSGGYTIHTALNTTAQEAVNEAFSLDSEISAQLFPANGPRHPVKEV